MSANQPNQTITGIAAVLTGGGALSMALFPFLLPTLLLTLVFVLPLAALALPAIPLVLAVLAARAIVRRLRAPDQLHARTPAGRERHVAQPDALGPGVGRA